MGKFESQKTEYGESIIQIKLVIWEKYSTATHRPKALQVINNIFVLFEVRLKGDIILFLLLVNKWSDIINC